MRALLERLGSFLPAAVALALPTVFLPITTDSFILPRVSIVIAAPCLGVGVALLVPRGPGLGALRWPLAAAAAAALLAFAFSVSWPLSLAGSYLRYESLPVRLGYLGLLASSVWLIRGGRSRDWIVPAFVLGTAIASLEAVAQWAGHAPYRPDGNLGNANLLAALIAMALPLAVWRGLRWSWWTVAWWASVIVMADGLVVTTSRSGVVGALAGFGVLAILASRGRWTLVAAAMSAVAMAGALAVILVSPLKNLNDDPPSLRLHLWQDALHLIGSRPITGWGEDATGLVFGHFLSRNYGSVVTFDRVHSGLLEIAATQGVLGLAALTWLLIVLLRGAWWHRHEGEVAPLAAALAGYTVWVAFNFDWAPATGAFWLLAGALWSEVQRTDQAASSAVTPAALWRTAVAVGLVGVAVYLAVLPILADLWGYNGRADLSAAADPLQAEYHWTLAEDLIDQGAKSGGVDELRRAADLGETDPSLYVELGDRELELGRRAQAIGDYRRAIGLDPYYGPALTRLASALLRG